MKTVRTQKIEKYPYRSVADFIETEIFNVDFYEDELGIERKIKRLVSSLAHLTQVLVDKGLLDVDDVRTIAFYRGSNIILEEQE